MLIKDEIESLISSAAEAAQAAGDLPSVAIPEVQVERPQRPEHGDYASSLPLRLARTASMPPLEIAKLIAGHIDAGETVEACALREVREEIGVGALHLARELGTTVHGYPRKGQYHVKTTYWFLMQTPENRFTPEAREGIEAVAWTPWSEAVRRIGYASLRDHMQRVEGIVKRKT